MASEGSGEGVLLAVAMLLLPNWGGSEKCWRRAVRATLFNSTAMLLPGGVHLGAWPAKAEEAPAPASRSLQGNGSGLNELRVNTE